jgi:hypothetical protein
MNLIIPFTKDIAFNSNISEILSISLEHDYTINEGELLGNFIVTGEYKTHEVSINKEYFEKVLPFSVELSELIDTNTLEFAIKDFTYEIIDPSTLRVNIEYEVNARETEVIKENTDVAVFREVEDVDFDEILDDAIKNLSENNTPQEQKRRK